MALRGEDFWVYPCQPLLCLCEYTRCGIINTAASKNRITDIAAPNAKLFARNVVRYIFTDGCPTAALSAPAIAKIRANIFKDICDSIITALIVIGHILGIADPIAHQEKQHAAPRLELAWVQRQHLGDRADPAKPAADVILVCRPAAVPHRPGQRQHMP